MKTIFFAIALVVTAVSAAAYTRADSCLWHSDIYPGTTHNYIVTVSDNYRPDHPSGLYVGLDGILCNAPAVMDSLSDAGILPPMIGVFLQPGVVRGADGSVIRYNRSNEFDAVNSRLASFLESELLPAVDGTVMPDGRVVTLPSEPQSRMIFGLSSGGIAAFNVAFRRPDLFGKVYTGCGTFVPMRGGEQVQVLVRKTEPAPVRFYIQDGFSDTWNPLFGSWFEANTLVNSALEFAGYDCAHDWAEGGHSVRRTSEIFPQVMTWMWRDRSVALAMPVSANSTLKEILIPGENSWIPDGKVAGMPSVRTEAVYPDSSFVAVAVPGQSRMLQSVIDPATGNRIYPQVFYYLHATEADDADVRDMEFDSNGNLWALTADGIQICDQNGRVRAIIRLPLKEDIIAISVMDGRVVLTASDGRRFTRRFNIAPAVAGVRPKSQGPA